MQNYHYPTQDCMGRSMNANSCGNNHAANTCHEHEKPSCHEQERMMCHEHEKTHCHTRQENDALKHRPIAMAYVPWQRWKEYEIYEIEKGFQRGTIFENLDKPFRGKGGCH